MDDQNQETLRYRGGSGYPAARVCKHCGLELWEWKKIVIVQNEITKHFRNY